MRIIYRAILMLFLLSCARCGELAAAQTICRIGIVEGQSKTATEQKWRPLAEYLSERLPEVKFEIAPFRLADLPGLMEKQALDFMIANPVILTEAMNRDDKLKVLATMKNKIGPDRYTCYIGSVIFTRKTDISPHVIEELRSRGFASVTPDAFGCWLLAREQMRSHHLNPETELDKLVFTGNHEKVIKMVQDGEVAAGSVRTGVLEKFAAAGKINLDDFRIINQVVYPKDVFPFLCSTPLYPEWGFVAMKDFDFSHKITMALLRLSPDSSAARTAGIGGWSLPYNYYPVAECLKRLQYGNFDLRGTMLLNSLWRHYKITIILLFCVIATLVILLLQAKRARAMMVRYANRLLQQIEELNLLTGRLNESEKQNRLLLDNAIVGIAVFEVITDSSGQAVDYICRRANPAFEQQCGLKIENVINRRASETIPQEEAREFTRIFGEVVLTDIKLTREYHITSLNRWLRIHAYKTEPLHLCALFYDVTELKKQEEELNLSHEQYMLAISGSNDGIWDWDMRKNTLFLSPRFKSMLGYRDHELDSSPLELKKYVHPDDLPVTENYIRHYLDGDANHFQLELRMRHKDGSYLWIQARGEAVRDAHGLPCRIAGSSSDITFRHRTEEELNTIYHNLPVIVMLLDRERKVIKANDLAKTFCDGEMVGLHCSQALGCTYAMKNGYGSDDHCAQCLFNQTISNTLKTGSSHKMVEATLLLTRQEDRKNREMTVLLSSILVHVNDDPMVLICLLDITDRKKVEDDLHAAMSDLEVTNRRLEEQTSIARTMTEQAKAADKAKSEFLARMSHEIRTPMNGVIGMTALLTDTLLSPVQQQYVSLIRSSGETLLNLINDILDFSKLEAGKITMSCIEFNLTETLEETVEVFALRAKEKNLELNLIVNPEIPALLLGDPFRIRQIITNLVGNSLKFTDLGEVSISVDLVSQNADNVILCIEVKDTGIGIPAECSDKLFSPFSQGDGSITRKFGGTGLGLVICKELVNMMSGEIGCENNDPRGSIFWFTIKLKKDSLSLPQPAVPARLDGLNVLVIAENKTLRDNLSVLLCHWNCRPVETDQAERVEFLLGEAARAQMPFDLVIIDKPMLTRESCPLENVIRRSSEQTRLVVMTSFDDDGIVNNDPIFRDGFLTKPLKQSTIYDSLCSIVEGHFAPQLQNPEHVHEQNETLKRTNLHLLLVEDNQTNQTVAAAILKSLGCVTDITDNGFDAIKKLEKFHYDFVLMDCQMPEMDGYETTRKIRQNERAENRPPIPIIALTANAIQGDRERCLDAGMDDYLVKPIDVNALIAIINCCLDGHAPPNPAPVPPENNQSEQIFCPEELLTRMMNDQSLVNTVIEGFLFDIPQQIAKLKDYIREDDLEHAQRQAHTIKGAAANISAHQLQKIAAEMERVVKDGKLSDIINMFPLLEAEFTTLKAELEQHLQTHAINAQPQ